MSLERLLCSETVNAILVLRFVTFVNIKTRALLHHHLFNYKPESVKKKYGCDLLLFLISIFSTAVKGTKRYYSYYLNDCALLLLKPF